ncbi:hypothetical protein M407DRAFT_17650 [Tulasnella calospora MUT 4182]|uniref:Uncharacterized protein n=1 Tax=Tulasnella calospora MUT 4182 TaxID=1051891 RepID=A0A0C3MIA1_9AGAM|nr:hypothetical protein M407DRAFT_17650 [Tulasnella calospora MUT 4182]
MGHIRTARRQATWEALRRPGTPPNIATEKAREEMYDSVRHSLWAMSNALQRGGRTRREFRGMVLTLAAAVGDDTGTRERSMRINAREVRFSVTAKGPRIATAQEQDQVILFGEDVPHSTHLNNSILRALVTVSGKQGNAYALVIRSLIPVSPKNRSLGKTSRFSVLN